MVTADFLRDLYAHMEWADSRVWNVVPTVAQPDEPLRNTLVHIHVVQRAFLHVWSKRSVMEAIRKPEDFATLSDVRAWAQPYYADVRAFVDLLGSDRLGEPVVMPWASQVEQAIGRPPAPTLLADTCFQVASHTTHHRGQVNTMLRRLGAEPPPVDYIFWVWLGRPAPEWS